MAMRMPVKIKFGLGDFVIKEKASIQNRDEQVSTTGNSLDPCMCTFHDTAQRGFRVGALTRRKLVLKKAHPLALELGEV
jgi:hypothetical protein